MTEDNSNYDEPTGEPEVPGNAPLISMSGPGGEPVPGEAGKITTGRVPKPIPRGSDTHTEPVEEPLSSDTIAMKRMAKRPPNEPVITFDEQPPEEPAPKKEPRRLKIFCHNCGQKLDLTDMESFSEIDCPSCEALIIVPMWFDNYLLEETCGKGGMATVYRGLDLALDREVAIKVLNQDVSGDENRNKLFLHEARTAATLNHYAILPIYTCGEYEDQPYIVMQFMAGGSLDMEIANHKYDSLPIGEAKKWLKDAAEGLDNARRHGIIHHDVKPGNLMLDDDRNVKIGDFGIAQAMHDTKSAELADAIKKWGSPHYVSPEKIETKQETYLGDIYSLGATFYHVLTGHTPFDSDDTKELLKMKTVRDPLHISKLRNDLPPPLADLIMSMMNRTPEARPSYRDIVAELNAMTKGSPKKKPAHQKRPSARTPAHTPRPPRSNVNAAGTKTDMGSTAPKFSSPIMRDGAPSKGSSLTLVVLLAITLAVLGGGYYFYTAFMGGAGYPQDADYLPDVTEYLSKGDTKMGEILADEAFKSSGDDLEVKRQAAVQLAISMMLNKARNAKAQCGSMLAELASSENDVSPESAILEYIVSKKQTPRVLRAKLPQNDGRRMAGEVAILVKTLYDGNSSRDAVEAYKNFMTLARYVPGKHWSSHSWRGRVPRWMNWLSKGDGNAKKLEPLISALKPKSLATLAAGGETPPVTSSSGSSSTYVAPGHLFSSTTRLGRTPHTSLTLDDLTPEWLASHRKFAASRPKPSDYTFSKSSVEDYLNSLPPDKVKRESERAGQVMPLKQHLCAMMFHTPYEDASLRLKDGRSFVGSMMANTKFISMKPKGAARTRVKWEEISPGQLADILAHYAALRGGADAGIAVSKGKQRMEAAWEYLRAGVICDWYGDYDNAVKYAKKATEYDPNITNEAIILMLE